MTPTDKQKEEIRWATKTLAKRQTNLRLNLDYYTGKHRMMISEERLKKVFGELFKDFRLNLCGAVVDALADRLQVQSFSAGEDEQVSQDAADVWKRNRMRRRSGHVHGRAVASGDSYLIVWADDQGFPIMYPQSSLEVVVEYEADQPGVIKRAAKLWKEPDGTHFLTLYYPERIEKYVTEKRVTGSSLAPTAWHEREVPGETWPLPNRYGRVPVFHFASGSDIGEYGVSELRDAIPVQDGLNKSVMDMLVNGEFQAYPQRYALNIEVKKDREGKPINPFKAGPERVWVLEGGENVSLGQFAAADISKMAEVKKGWSLDMAQVTQTPPHYFMLPSGLVSGESQKTAEQKLDAKVTDRQIAFGDTWADAMAFALEVWRGGRFDGLELDTNWKDTKPRNELEEWQKSTIKEDLGVSRRQILREQGYTDKQIDQFEEDRSRDSLGQMPIAAIPAPQLSLET